MRHATDVLQGNSYRYLLWKEYSLLPHKAGLQLLE